MAALIDEEEEWNEFYSPHGFGEKTRSSRVDTQSENTIEHLCALSFESFIQGIDIFGLMKSSSTKNCVDEQNEENTLAAEQSPDLKLGKPNHNCVQTNESLHLLKEIPIEERSHLLSSTVLHVSEENKSDSPVPISRQSESSMSKSHISEPSSIHNHPIESLHLKENGSQISGETQLPK